MRSRLTKKIIHHLDLYCGSPEPIANVLTMSYADPPRLTLFQQKQLKDCRSWWNLYNLEIFACTMGISVLIWILFFRFISQLAM